MSRLYITKITYLSTLTITHYRHEMGYVTLNNGQKSSVTKENHHRKSYSEETNTKFLTTSERWISTTEILQ